MDHAPLSEGRVALPMITSRFFKLRFDTSTCAVHARPERITVLSLGGPVPRGRQRGIGSSILRLFE